MQVLVGDPHQLPPVGPGCVLQDLISAQLFPRVGAVGGVRGLGALPLPTS